MACALLQPCSPWAPATAHSSRQRRRGDRARVHSVARESQTPADGSGGSGGKAGASSSGQGSSAASRPSIAQPSSSSGGGAPSLSPASRRAVLQAAAAAATVGSLHAWAGRAVAATDAASLLGGGAAQAASASSLLERQLDERLTEFTLPNGLRFLVFERRAAPIASFHIYADVGAFDEEDGQTGLAHLLEHMAFKGTSRIGSRDYRQEAPLLEALDETFYELQSAGSGPAAARLQQQLDTLQRQAAALSVPNAYGALLQQEGGVGLNAATSHDATKYYVSLPANKAELWFAMEADRFQQPVFRELYSEKRVVLEERRLRVDNSPLGPFSEAFALASLSNHYRRPVIGYPDDIERLGRREVQAFFQRHYGPANLTIAVAGDVRPAEIRRLAERYFGGWRSDAQPPSSCAGGVEALAAPSTPKEEWEYRAKSRAGPGLMHAYYRPCIRHPDSLTLDLASDLLSGTRSSRLYRSLILGGKALTASAYASYPADKYPATFSLYSIPAKGGSLDQLDSLVTAEVAALAESGPSAEELLRYKKAARMELLDALGSNTALAAALATYQALAGDWRGVLTDLQRIEALQPAEVRDACQRWLRPDNCFRGFVLPM